jgi:hypothetical protein
MKFEFLTSLLKSKFVDQCSIFLLSEIPDAGCIKSGRSWEEMGHLWDTSGWYEGYEGPIRVDNGRKMGERWEKMGDRWENCGFPKGVRLA